MTWVEARFEAARRQAVNAEEAGDAIAATARWAQAADATSDSLLRVEALAAARRQTELAFHQAVWEAQQRHSWRQIGPRADMAWQTLYRRYRQPPARPLRRRVELDTMAIARLIKAEDAAAPHPVAPT